MPSPRSIRPSCSQPLPNPPSSVSVTAASAGGSQSPGDLISCSGLPASEARILLAHVTGWSRTELITAPQVPLPEAQEEAFATLAARRRAGEPIAYLVGAREFYGRRFKVSPAVLIPRPETELLVDEGLAALGALSAPRVLDLGTGSGAIAVTVALERPDAHVTAADLSPAALEIARHNGRVQGARIDWVESDWYAALGARRFHLVLANPPYVAADDPHLNQGDVRFEPRGALTDGGGGRGALRTVIQGAPAHLEPAGMLLVEHGYDQAEAVRAAFAAAGFLGVRSVSDLAGIERVTRGVLPG